MGLLSGLATLARTALGALSTPGGLLAGTAVTGAVGAAAGTALATTGAAPLVGPGALTATAQALGTGFLQATQRAGVPAAQVATALAGGQPLLGPQVPQQFFGGGGAGAPQLSALGGQPIQQLQGGRTLWMMPDGSIATSSRSGQLVRPSKIVMAGERLPPGATIVAISADRTRIGITTRRRRRPFGAQLNQVRRVVRGAQAITRLCAPKTRRK